MELFKRHSQVKKGDSTDSKIEKRDLLEKLDVIHNRGSINLIK